MDYLIASAKGSDGHFQHVVIRCANFDGFWLSSRCLLIAENNEIYIMGIGATDLTL